MSALVRPTFHFTPPANWMNDPNGLVYYKGEYHLFYQYHPHSCVWGPMHWGHAISHDLVNWEHLPIALHPDENGTIFSGSAVVDWENTAGFGKEALIAIFTYKMNYKETQNLAYSTDNGRTWTKYTGNPVIPAPDPLSDCRDPKVFWHKDHWVMLLAAKDRILFYASRDLKQWKQTGIFGNGFGSTVGVWETPELFQLPVEKGTRWVLSVGVSDGAPAGGSGTQYFIGDFDGTFTSENSKETILWADHGADYYAPQSWNDEPNGRRLMIGWLNNWQYANLVPASTWRGMFSLVREISLKRADSGICLVQRPIPEIQNLRNEHQHWQDETVVPDTNLLADVHGKSLELIAEFECTKDVDRFGFHIRKGSNSRTTICYSVRENTITIDRTKSGNVDFHPVFPSAHSTVLSPTNKYIRLHIFVDSTSIEVFADEGLITFTEYIFPDDQSQGLELFVEGGAVLLHALDVFHLDPATFQIKKETL